MGKIFSRKTLIFTTFIAAVIGIFISITAFATTEPGAQKFEAVTGTTCPDLELIFARGSGQGLNDGDYQSFKTNIERAFSYDIPGIRVHFYELGSETQDSHRYPAVGLSGFKTILGAYVSAGDSYAYGKSVKEGALELASYANTVIKTCPETKIAIAGYSQGAQVVDMGERKLKNMDNIIYTATFGDPKVYFPEGKDATKNACQGKNLSTYRVYAPDCFVDEGILGALKPYIIEGQYGRLGTWCNDADMICGSWFNISPSGDGVAANLFRGHTTYSEFGYPMLANIISERMMKILKNTYVEPEPTSDSEKTDDNTNSDSVIPGGSISDSDNSQDEIPYFGIPGLRHAVSRLTVDATFSKTYELGEGYHAIYINEVFLGVTDQTKITITDLQTDVENEIKIARINSDGRASVEISEVIPAGLVTEDYINQNKTIISSVSSVLKGVSIDESIPSDQLDDASTDAEQDDESLPDISNLLVPDCGRVR